VRRRPDRSRGDQRHRLELGRPQLHRFSRRRLQETNHRPRDCAVPVGGLQERGAPPPAVAASLPLPHPTSPSILPQEGDSVFSTKTKLEEDIAVLKEKIVSSKEAAGRSFYTSIEVIHPDLVYLYIYSMTLSHSLLRWCSATTSRRRCNACQWSASATAPIEQRCTAWSLFGHGLSLSLSPSTPPLSCGAHVSPSHTVDGQGAPGRLVLPREGLSRGSETAPDAQPTPHVVFAML
jgi:hypothetical protein